MNLYGDERLEPLKLFKVFRSILSDLDAESPEDFIDGITERMLAPKLGSELVHED